MRFFLFCEIVVDSFSFIDCDEFKIIMSTTDAIFTVTLPNQESEFILHSCCAPCSTAIIESCVASGIKPIIFYYNPNIYPHEEYLLRKEENIRYAKALGLSFIDGDYETTRWKKYTAGWEHEPERGQRCQLCFDLRLEVTAQLAYEKGVHFFATTLASSRWKSISQITKAGQRAANMYDGVEYWTQDWRKNGLSNRKEAIIKQFDFYQQQYCGCAYSLRDSNQWRKDNGRPLIVLLKAGSNIPM